jgi:hypothetical protein
MKVEKLETGENEQSTAQDILDEALLQKVLATWTITVVHPVTSGAGVDSPKRRRRPHWTTAKGYTWEMEAE